MSDSPAGTPTFIISATDVRKYLPVDACVAAVESAFRLLGRGQAEPPVTVGLHAPGGSFHIKAGILELNRPYFAAKANANFPSNGVRGLPTIQGLVTLYDAADGRVLAVINSSELTARRTAAASAVAAKYFAPRNARTAAIVGCGFQAAAQLQAITHVLPLETMLAVDAVDARAQRFANDLRVRHDMHVTASSFADAINAAPDVWITCTTSQEFFLFPEHVQPGAFVAGVGVDNAAKRELAPALLQQAHVVTDRTEQCAQIGDLHHAITAGVTPMSVTELGEVVAGVKPGRTDERAIYVFDSTGIAIQDVAAAAAVFEAAQLDFERGDRTLVIVDFNA